MNKFLVVIAIIGVGALSAPATSFIEPLKHRVYSANKQYFVLVDPINDLHSIRPTRSPWKILWHFKQRSQFDSIFLADSGETAFWVAWEFVDVDNLDQDAVVIFRRHGEDLRFSFNEVSHPREAHRGEVSPVGDSIRLWRDGVEQTPTGIRISPSGRPDLTLEESSKKK